MYFLSGLIGQLEPGVFSLLMKLQVELARIVKSVGNIEHEVYPPNVCVAIRKMVLSRGGLSVSPHEFKPAKPLEESLGACPTKENVTMQILCNLEVHS